MSANVDYKLKQNKKQKFYEVDNKKTETKTSRMSAK